jgi:hypothetical protein
MKALIGADREEAVIPSLGHLKIEGHQLDLRKERLNSKVIQQYLAPSPLYFW